MRKRRFLWLVFLILALGFLLWGTDTFAPQEAEPPSDALPQTGDNPAQDTPLGAEPPTLASTDAHEPPAPSPTESGRLPGTLRGQVRDAATGKAIAGASVEAELADGRATDGRMHVRPIQASEVRATTSDAEGRFLCRLVPGPTYRLRVTAAGHAPAVTLPTHVGATLVILLHPLLEQRGRVIDERGKPVAGAVLRFRIAHPLAGVSGWRPPVVLRVTTDTNGTFDAALAAGLRHHVTITHAELATHEQWFIPGSAGLEFQMERGSLVRGHVGRASDREPLAGAWIRSGSLIRGHSGPDGSFRISGLGAGLLYVGAEGYASQVLNLRTQSGALEVWLQASRVLRGTVLVPAGVTPAGLLLEVRGHGKRGAPIEHHRVLTDAQGAYRVNAAGRSPGYVVICRAPGLQGVLTSAPPADENEVNLGTLRLQRAEAILRGVVTGPTPPTRVLLQVTPHGPPPASDETTLWRLQRTFGTRLVFADAGGQFVVEGLAAGTYRVTASAQGWPDLRQDLTLPTQTDSLVLAMRGELRIRGRLIDSEERPLSGYSCRCDRRWGRTVTDAQGRFELRGAARSEPANSYTLAIRSSGSPGKRARLILRIHVQAGDQEQVFRAPGPADIQGRVDLEPGRRHQQYTVEALVGGRVVATAQGDDLGFILRGIKAARVEVRARKTLVNGTTLWEAGESGVTPGARHVVLRLR